MSQKKSGERSLELAITIDAPIEAVWKALTEAEELVRWFPLEAGEKEDGTLWMSWDGDFRFEGRAAASDPPHRTRFVYYQPPPGRDPSELRPEDFVEIATEYTLASDRGKTSLRLVHAGFGAGEDWDEQYEATRTGWEVELRGLRHYLESHRGRDRVVAWAKTPFTASRAEAWRRLMSEDALLGEGDLGGVGEGSPYRFRARNGDRFEGVVRLHDEPRNFVATVDNLGNALLRVRLEDLYGRRQAHLFLSAYELPREDVRAFERRWQEELDRLFPSA